MTVFIKIRKVVLKVSSSCSLSVGFGFYIVHVENNIQDVYLNKVYYLQTKPYSLQAKGVRMYDLLQGHREIVKQETYQSVSYLVSKSTLINSIGIADKFSK